MTNDELGLWRWDTQRQFAKAQSLTSADLSTMLTGRLRCTSLSVSRDPSNAIAPAWDRQPELEQELTMEQKRQFIESCGNLYRRTLLEDVVPFWLEHGVDTEYGGISNVIDDSGKVVSHDKYLWSQGRALWTFSALYNRIEKRGDWLAFADHIYRYLATHGRDDQGRWMYRLDSRGNVLERDTSIYVDAFVMCGLSEYYAATGNEEALQLALDTYQNTLDRINRPGSYRTAPYAIPAGMKAHGVAMIFSFFYYNLGKIANRPAICRQALELGNQVLDDFYVPEKNAILEYVSLDGEFVDCPEGRVCVPGHGLEALWFLISIFERADRKDRIRTCCRLIRRHLELGWDEEYGGIRLALDIDGKGPPHWKNPDCKPWWAQVEALVATGYAYVHTAQDWALDWHERIQQYAFSHYPVPTGEWTQWLDRQGNKTASAALPVKDPFHLPRALIYLIDLFENRMNGRGQNA